MIARRLLCSHAATIALVFGSALSPRAPAWEPTGVNITTRVDASGGVMLLQGRSVLSRSRSDARRMTSINTTGEQQHPVSANRSLLSDTPRVTQRAKHRPAQEAKAKKGRAARRKFSSFRRHRRRPPPAASNDRLDSARATPGHKPEPAIGVGESSPPAASWLSVSGSLSENWPYSVVPTTLGPTLAPLQNFTAEKIANITEFRKRARRNCEVSDWSDWSDCHDDHPDDGLKAWVSKRKRLIVTPPLEGGKPCPGLLMRSLCKFEFKIFSGQDPYDHELHGSWIPVPPLPDIKIPNIKIPVPQVPLVP
mmetsp:Transcript_106371/g.184978  ORF Transcript_106371/g.184978 Transcript_106371/m.184978 type:complete len:308 (-) Transcript_106371:111-1034(-)